MVEQCTGIGVRGMLIYRFDPPLQVKKQSDLRIICRGWTARPMHSTLRVAVWKKGKKAPILMQYFNRYWFSEKPELYWL